MNWDDIKIIQQETNWYTRGIREAIEEVQPTTWTDLKERGITYHHLEQDPIQTRTAQRAERTERGTQIKQRSIEVTTTSGNLILRLQSKEVETVK